MRLLFICFVVICCMPFKATSQNSIPYWETFFKNKIQDLTPLEGIWSQDLKFIHWDRELTQKSEYFPQNANVVVYKDGNIYRTKFFANSSPFDSEITFTTTALSALFLVQAKFLSTYSIAKASATLTANGLLEFKYEVPTEELKYIIRKGGMTWYDERVFLEHKLVKIFPKESDLIKKKEPDLINKQIISGTGFAISSNGFIATNFHVVDGASSIKVRGINSDFSKYYTAKLLTVDKINDLAIIQIDDNSFSSLGSIPYIIKPELELVGENIFVLGYPLRATMGDEIKLTNGIISSRTGFQGAVSSYQLSAPVQPGNSGGPLFNSSGNLIGIVNAKHAGAENASYAIKSNYILNLLELLPNPIRLSTVNTLSGKNLSSQVEIVKKFVYILEIE